MFSVLWRMSRVWEFILLSGQQCSLQVSWQILAGDMILAGQRERLYYSTASSMNSIIPPSASGITWKGPGGHCLHSGLGSQLRNREFRKSESFIMGTKRICLNFILEREPLSWLYWTVNKRALGYHGKH